MAKYFDRYSSFRLNGTTATLPFLPIPPKGTDKEVVFRIGRDRTDKLSQTFYGNPYCGWLIMLANPQYGGLEFLIPNRTILRIPYPLTESLQQYINNIQTFDQLYGIFNGTSV
jgi:hypothetical protein